MSYSQTDTIPFSIDGKTKNIEDGTWLYLIDTAKDVKVDSAVVNNNSFYIKSLAIDLPINAVLHTADYKHYNFLWIDEADITFDSTKESFRDAIVSGKLNELQRELRESYKGKSRKDRRDIEKQFIYNHPNSIISANMLSIYKTTFGRGTVIKMFLNFSENNKQSVYGKSIAEYISLNKGELHIGDKFIDFEMMDHKGTNRKLSDIKSKYILLEFWASWCGPCRKENPNLVSTYKKYNNRGFEIFAVSEDTKKKNWLDAIDKDQLSWIHVSDLNKSNKASMIYDINGIPDNFLIDQYGTIIAHNLRGDELDKKLSELLK